MTKVEKQIHYAGNVHGQINSNFPYAVRRFDWADPQKASASAPTIQPKGSICSAYEYYIIYDEKDRIVQKYQRKPWILTAHDFKLEIPECAYIRKITFTARMKVDSKLNVKAPYGHFNIYHGTKPVDTLTLDDTGWDDGYWNYNPNKKLSSSWQDIQYVLTGDNFRKRGYPVSELNRTVFGIDFRWYDSNKSDNDRHDIFVKYVTVEVEYELPDQSIVLVSNGNLDNPRVVTAGEEYIVNATYSNKSNAECCDSTDRVIHLDLPPNTRVEEVLDGDFHFNDNTWHVKCTPNNTENLQLLLKDIGIGYQNILFESDFGDSTYYLYSVPNNTLDVGYIYLYAQGIIQRGMNSCVRFISKVNSHNDTTVTFHVDMDTVHHSASDIIWTPTDECSEGVNLLSSTDTELVFEVPRDTVVDIVWTGCFISSFEGDSKVSVQLDNNPPVLMEYECYPAPVFKVTNVPKTESWDWETAEIEFTPAQIIYTTHRFATTTELGAYVIDCSVAPFDGNMECDDCTLTMTTWQPVDYIGMVPLEHPHYDPQATYENKEIWESHKNKTYGGKENIIDEDIDLNFRVNPHRVPDLYGLIKLDKPTPINANHKCFEGDPLNHRGWAVFSKLEVDKTNPLYYDCKGTVKYLTHDINTKFQINKLQQVNNQEMPEVMEDLFSLGDNLSTALDIFQVDTDGGFIYDDTEGDTGRNLFSLDNDQYLFIQTRNPLLTKSKVQFDWYSTKLSENRENNMSRIFRIRNSNGDAVFEYEYTNFTFYEDYVTCDVIMRVANQTGWDTARTETIELATEIDLDVLGTDVVVIDDDYDEDEDYDGDEVDDEDYNKEDEDYIAPSFDPNKFDINMIYGSSLTIKLDGDKLRIIDGGYNGREFSIDGNNDDDCIQLVGSDFKFETEWHNNTTDAMAEDIISYIDIAVTETMLGVNYANQYKDLIVSPFPVKDKNIIFTRECDDGTLYYLTGEEPYKFMLEPYYQYQCGTDLVSSSGISVWDLNNSYTRYYISNGLVRLGFSKISGNISLGKYDFLSGEWITTHYFHVSNDITYEKVTLSDDKIVIKAGEDTFFTIWRGHPFIAIQHPNMDISIDSRFNYAFADKCNGLDAEFPMIFNFMNTDNLLPACVGGQYLDYDCVEIEDDDIIVGTDHTITVNVNSEELLTGQPTLFSAEIDPTTPDGEVHWLINNKVVGVTEYNPQSQLHEFSYTFEEKEIGDNTVQVVYAGDDDDNIAISEPITITLWEPQIRDGSDIDDMAQDKTLGGHYKLAITSAPSKFTYRDGKKVVLTLTKGGVPFCTGTKQVIETQRPTGGGSAETNAQGQVIIKNENYDVGKYQWGGRFYDSTDEDNDRKLIYTALRYIEIVKAKPKFYSEQKGKVITRGSNVAIKLQGVSAQNNNNNSGLRNKKVSYRINDGKTHTKTTSNKDGTNGGKIYIPMNSTGNMKITVYYAGDKNYEPCRDNINVKVVK